MKKKTIIRYILIIAIFVITILEIAPIILIILNSFKTDKEIWFGNPFSFFIPTLNSYHNVISSTTFTHGLLISLIVGVLVTIISVMLGALAAYGLTRFKFRGRNVIAYSMLSSRMIPQLALMVPFYMLFRTFGMLDMTPSLVIAYISFNIPYAIWMLLPFFASVPKSFEEAATIDGASRNQIFWRIVLPLAVPGLSVASIFVFINSWNEFLYALILTGSKDQTAPIAIMGYLGEYTPKWGEISAAGMIMLIPAFIIALFMQKYVIEGLSIGGVKG